MVARVWPTSFWKIVRLGGLSEADCYAAIVLADNATFLLAVNRMTAFCHSPQSDDIMLGQSTAAVAQPAMKMWVRVPPEAEFVHMFVPTSVYSVDAELSYLGFG